MAVQNSVMSEALEAVALYCPELQRLSLDGCTRLTPSSLRRVVGRCKDLTQLHSGSVSCVDTSVLREWSRRTLAVTVLVVPRCRGVDDEGLALLAQLMHSATQVDVRFTNVTDAGIALLTKHCKALKIARLGQGSLAVSDASVMPMLAGNSQMHELDLSHTNGAVTDAALCAAALHTRELRAPNLGWTRGTITDVGLLSIT